MKKRAVTVLILIYVIYISIWTYRLIRYSKLSGVTDLFLMLLYFSAVFVLFLIFASPGMIGLFWFSRSLTAFHNRIVMILKILGGLLSIAWVYFWLLPPFAVKLPGWQLLHDLFGKDILRFFITKGR